MTIEDTMACSAFAEAGEPCPICEKPGETKPADKPATSNQVSTDFACAAFHEQNLECPIGTDKKK